MITKTRGPSREVLSAMPEPNMISMMDDEPKTIPCPDCGGTGKVPSLDNSPGPTVPEQIMIECPMCRRTGEVREDRP
jgi:hypothetical protein